MLGVHQEVLQSYFSWRRGIYPDDGRAISAEDLDTPEFRQNRETFQRELQNLMERFESEVPKFSPRYIGHIFSETSMPAIIGHVVTLLHNPNNISGESSRVGVAIEEEAIGALAKMVGFTDEAEGHFTSGGTIANFEAMVRARRRMERFIEIGARARSQGLHKESLFNSAHMGWDCDEYFRGFQDVGKEATRYDLTKNNPFVVAARLSKLFSMTYQGPVVLVPEHKHYSWVKGVDLMGIGREAFWPVQLDEDGVMCVRHLEEQIEKARRHNRPIMMVVSVAGTTELGAFDPIHRVQDLLDRYRDGEGIYIWHHVDAAYGGFFASNICGNQHSCVMAKGVCEAMEAMGRANSITLDPHKLGYVPYSSGAFICAEPREYFASTIDAPYLKFDGGRDRGPQTIEGSRSAAGAVATWLTAKTIGLDSNGYGRILRRTISARRRLQNALQTIDLPVRLIPASSNLLAFCIAQVGESLQETNARTEAIYEAFSPHKDGEFFVSRTALRFSAYQAFLDPFIEGWEGKKDADEVILVRLCVMNPFFDSRETNVDFPEAFARELNRRVKG